MDSARFGRVLGIGTRLAAKTVASAVDAAMAPNPNAAATAGTKAEQGADGGRDARAAAAAASARLAEKAAQSRAQVVQTGQGLKRGGRQFGEAAWRPFVRLSGVLWLEFTGVFFGLFAVSAGVGAWKLRAGVHAAATDHAHTQFLIAAAVAVVFGYFCVSSFVRAARRERKR
jgi:hypothetical protein